MPSPPDPQPVPSDLTPRDPTRSDALYHSIVESLDEGIWAIDDQARTIFVSTRMAAMVGYEPNEMLGLTPGDFTGGQPRPIGARPGEITNPDVSRPQQVRLRHRDGHDVWVRVSTASMTVHDNGHHPDSGNDPAKVLLIDDVTEQRQLDEAVRRERVRFRALVQHSTDVIFVITADGAIDYASPAVHDLVGASPTEVRGDDIAGLLVDESGAADLRAGFVASTSQLGVPVPQEIGFRHRDGSIRHCEVTAHNLVDNPSVGGIVLNVRDITATRHAEQRIHTLLNASEDIILILYEDGSWFASPAGTRILGYAPGYSTPDGILSLIHPDDVELVAEAQADLIAGRRDIDDRIEARVRTADDGYRWLEITGRNLSDDPLIHGLVITARDVTARRETEAKLRTSEAWFRALLKNQTDIVSVIDTSGITQYMSPNAERVLGFSQAELEETSTLDRIHPEDQDVLFAGFFAQIEEGAEPQPLMFRHLRADGTWLWLEATVSKLPSGFEIAGEIIDGVIVNARDVSERRRVEDEFREAFRGSPVGIGFAKLDGEFTWVNAALSELLGVTEQGLIGTHVDKLSGAGDLAHDQANIRALIDGEIPHFTTETHYEHPSGRTVWALLHLSLIRDGEGAPNQLLGQVEDISERKHREFRHRHDAEHDALTGSWNRAGMQRLLQEAWQARDPKHPLALLFADLNGFKHVNDKYGHAAGDDVLEHVASRLGGAVRGGDQVARWGGDEFLVLCPGVRDEAEAAGVAQRLRDAIARPFRVPAGDIHVGISVGIAVEAGQDSPDCLLAEADAASYQEKRETEQAEDRRSADRRSEVDQPRR